MAGAMQTAARQNYSSAEWQQREIEYQSLMGKLQIPAQPATTDIMNLLAQIDAIQDDAIFDLAYTKRKLEYIKMQMKLAETEAFTILKNDPVNLKKTEADLKGMVVIYLKNNPVQGVGQHQIYQEWAIANSRFTYMEAVVRVLSEKRSALVTDNGMMKLEAQVSGGPPNA